MNKTFLILAFAGILISCSGKKAGHPDIPFYDETLSNERRADDLIKRMTLEEKVSQLNYQAAAIDRLGIPAYNWWNECLHGVGRAGLATVFPQAIGLGATWDRDLMNQAGTVISDEARAKHEEFLRHDQRRIYYGLTFWTPNINIFRDPHWGRGQETYGEDPFLTGTLAVSFIRGLQGDDPKYLKLVATSKHFAVHSGPEPERHSIDVNVAETDLRETYLPAFEMTVKEAGVASVMCAYNSVRGEACCGSNLLLKRILRDEWNFQGYVVSDCWALTDFYREGGHHVSKNAVEAAALSYKNGTDLNCGITSPNLIPAVKQGLISEDVVDQSVRRLFLARLRLGMFDEPDHVKYAQIPYGVVRDSQNQEIALKASRESLVLLKNNGILPLKKSIKKLAVIGPLADDYQNLLGNYHGTSDHLITPLKGIRDLTAAGGTRVTYSPGCTLADGVPLLTPIPASALKPADGQGHGLTASYYGNKDFSGDPSITRTDTAIDFWWYDHTPVTQQMADEFSVRWEGALVPETSGKYYLGLDACNAAKMWVEDSLYIQMDNEHAPDRLYFPIDLVAGKSYKLKIDFDSYGNDPQAHLLWSVPGMDLEKDALEKAKESDAVVLVMGLSPMLEGEEMPVQLKGFSGGDRTDLVLPDSQEKLMEKITALGKPTVLVLSGGSAIAINWADAHVPAILEAWYPGEWGGQAIAEAIFGDINPSGRLPVTFYQSVKDLPPFDDYSMTNRTYKYFKGQPLYPFGFGLSYTQFTYSDLKFSSPEISDSNDLTVTVTVKNAGSREGMEVVELYVSDKKAEFPVPRISLKGFEKISLKPGESKPVSFILHPGQWAEYNPQGEKVLGKGEYTVYAGGKQPGFKGHADAATTQVVSGVVKYSGDNKIMAK